MSARPLAALGAVWLILCTPSCAFVCPPDELHEETPPSSKVEAPAGVLEAGAAKLDITPADDVFLGGFGFFRRSEGVHDPIWARALALRRGGVTAVILSADLVGLHHHHVEQVRDRLAARGPRARASREAVLVHATHNHQGPDTMGLWGLPPIMSGIDDEYQAFVLDSLVRAAEKAIAALGPARLRWGQLQAPEQGISRNKRDPQLIDRTVTALGLDRPDGTAIATLVHFACHPESLGSKNRLLSADFPFGLYAETEAARPGSVTVFLNGPLGGMVTTHEADETFAEAERIGRAIGRLALDALDTGTDAPEQVELVAAVHPVWMPIRNRTYHLGSFFGVFGGRPFESGYTPTEVQALRVGPVVLLTAPGEVLPKLGFQLQGLIEAPVALVVSLGNDELGYLIHEDDREDERYDYERTVSPGPLAPVLLRATARDALSSVGALSGEEDEDRR